MDFRRNRTPGTGHSSIFPICLMVSMQHEVFDIYGSLGSEAFQMCNRCRTGTNSISLPSLLFLCYMINHSALGESSDVFHGDLE